MKVPRRLAAVVALARQLSHSQLRDIEAILSGMLTGRADLPDTKTPAIPTKPQVPFLTMWRPE